jgi:hypothetical protein
MAVDGVRVTVMGLPDLRATLARIPAALRRGPLRNALAAGGRVFQRFARRLTPVLTLAVRRADGRVVRLPGTVRKAISVRTSKLASRRGNVGVFVNVRPAKGAKFRTERGIFGTKRRRLVRASQRGADNPRDPYYWRWLEFGKRGYAGAGMLQKAARRTAEAVAAIVAALGPAVDRVIKRKGL